MNVADLDDAIPIELRLEPREHEGYGLDLDVGRLDLVSVEEHTSNQRCADEPRLRKSPTQPPGSGDGSGLSGPGFLHEHARLGYTPVAKIVHLSDLHFGRPTVSERLESIKDVISSIEPDMVAASEDLTRARQPGVRPGPQQSKLGITTFSWNEDAGSFPVKEASFPRRPASRPGTIPA